MIVETAFRFPETGAFIVCADPNSAGFREGLREVGVRPFIQVAVSFDPANAFDRSSWVAATRLFIHPSLPGDCLSPHGCNPTTVGVFPAGDPARADLGLALLDRPVRNISPAMLARSGGARLVP